MPAFKSKIVSDTFEQLKDTAKQTKSQLTKVPKDLWETGSAQVKGQKSDKGDGDAETGIEQLLTGAGGGKPTKKSGAKSDSQLNPQQELKLRAEEERRKSMARYQQIVAELKKYRQQKAQETPAYVAGKPGAPRDKVEEVELWKKQEAEKEKKKKEVILPGKKHLPGGTQERVKKITG